MGYTIFAAIQVGSSEMSMKIYEISRKNGIKELDYVRHAIEIGAETYIKNRLNHDTINDICDVLIDYKRIMKSYGVTEYTAVASSAIREANNSTTILDRIRLATGIKVRVLSNSEKRFLYYKAVALKNEDFERLISDSTSIVDVGAGSMQVSLYNKDKLISTQNILLGFLRIMEVLAEYKEHSKNYIQLMEEYINNDLKTYKELFLHDAKVKNIIAIGDNINELSGILFNGQQGNIVTKNNFDIFYDKLININPDLIASEQIISKEQASMLIPTAMIYKKMFELTGAQNMWVPRVQLNDGMAVDYAVKIENIATTHDFTADIVSVARQLADKYMCDTKHSLYVEQITLKIFDSLRKVHGMGKRERLLAQLAAILHNCGAFINMNEVPINSYNIIMSTEIIGLSNNEKEMLAHMVKGINNDIPRLNELPGSTDRDEYINIVKITAILRIADAMDKGHMQKFERIDISLTEQNMNIIAASLFDISLEKGEFEKKAAFFMEVYGIKLRLKKKKQ